MNTTEPTNDSRLPVTPVSEEWRNLKTFTTEKLGGTVKFFERDDVEYLGSVAPFFPRHADPYSVDVFSDGTSEYQIALWKLPIDKDSLPA